MLLKKMYIIIRSRTLKIKYLNLLTQQIILILILKKNEVKGQIPSITNLATTAALIAVENKISDVSNLVKKTDYNTKIQEFENKVTDHDHSNKYITTPEFNKLTAGNIAAKLKQANLTSKSDIANFANKRDFDKKIIKL